ncbi:hypothetical protein LOTGIDRAFT_174672 [Lottia gigantea]|uniref:Immunoglobulin V-set domain-containing protein n=1 Tax=Lottia gigantea TaxID=225164 RepID=V4AQE7_LOTGI|nr:hypothetical protein LOTGIDRAFT_174672 [Lottia gigantea]ESO97040.1 hypothetical protein LOTGIDRAFT_174672 [Lottia gigantea]
MTARVNCVETLCALLLKNYAVCHLAAEVCKFGEIHTDYLFECMKCESVYKYNTVIYNGSNFDFILPGIGNAKYDSVIWYYKKPHASQLDVIGYWLNGETEINKPFHDKVEVRNQGQHNMTLHVEELESYDTGIYEQAVVLANSTERKIKKHLAVPYKVWRFCSDIDSVKLQDIPPLENKTVIEQFLKVYSDNFSYSSKPCDDTKITSGLWVLAEFLNGNVSCLSSKSKVTCTDGTADHLINRNRENTYSIVLMTLVLVSEFLVKICL